jgi:hypothetical protein
MQAKSIPALAKTTPVIPPTVNKKIKPTANNIGVVNSIKEPAKVANQENIFTPVGTAIIKVAEVNKLSYQYLDPQYTYDELIQ